MAGARIDLRRGQRVVLCGAPNAGKSTLLNAWAGEQRVLVDATPGTTRDPVEVELTRALGRWTVVDTAGIREGAAGLEAAGIDLALQRVRGADLAVWLLAADAPSWPLPQLLGTGQQTTDPSTDGRREGGEAVGLTPTAATVPLLVVGSKADLLEPAARRALADEVAQRGFSFAGWVSGRSGEGVQALRDNLEARLGGAVRAGEVVVVRQRHLEALQQADAALGRLQDGRRSVPEDLLAGELEEATRALGAIVGRDVDQAVLERIFSEFCIGK